MKKFVATSLVVMLAAAAQAANAADPAELAKAKGCLNCHSVDTKIVGPAYKEVAQHYAKADPKATENQLVKKVLNGTSGTYGPVAMPPNAGVSEAEAHILVKWVLSLK
jgi:cytochrome c